ncbi:MAG TPA: EthD family reductase [Streptosporangiaceae bacterium]|nr:EthD family reductase [Streptosporangiaceae bacterium]
MYPRPTDAAAFDRHYFDVHVPLARQLPGLRHYSVSRNGAPIRGPEPFHLVAELDWDDMESLRRDFASALGQETARDVEDNLARLCPGVHSMVFELDEL